MKFESLDPRQALSSAEAYGSFQKTLLVSRTWERITSILAIRPGDRVLDVGCGPAEVLSHLPAGVEYFGFDVSPKYIAAASHRYGNRGTFTVGAVTPGTFSDFGQFDVIIAMGVLHHLDDNEAKLVFQAAREKLRPEGRIVTMDGAYVRGQNPIAKLLLTLDRGRHVRTVEQYLTIARPFFPNIAATVMHDLIALPYTHLFLRASRERTVKHSIA